MLNESVLRLLSRRHGKVERVEKHVKVGGYEVDAVLFFRKSRLRVRVGVGLIAVDSEDRARLVIPSSFIWLKGVLDEYVGAQ